MQKSYLTLLTDFYQLSMMQGYFIKNIHDEVVVFDVHFRKNPSKSAYSIFAGLEQLIEFIKDLKFTDEDIDYLRSLNFEESFLEYLRSFKFDGDIYSVKEGSIIFPNEPIIVIKSKINQAQFIETILLNIINHQCLIATKASRICDAADGDTVFEFGARRAQGPDSAIYGTRAAVIGGCVCSSNVLAGKMFGIPVIGTHSHSWVMNFDTEIEAFREYAKVNEENVILLVDTYNSIKSGIPNAIKVFLELKEQGKLKRYGIRLDSGDFAYLSKVARTSFDEAGLHDAVIVVSSDLDENIIESLKIQGAKIDVWGVGTKLITSYDCPSFGGVFKLVAKYNDDEYIPKIKVSDNVKKITNPGYKKIYRLYGTKNKIKADYITLHDEMVDATKDLEIFDPESPWKKKTLIANQYTAVDMLVPIFIDGECVYTSPSVMEIREYCLQQKNTLWEENKRLTYPQEIHVDLSKNLFELKQKLIHEKDKYNVKN